MGQTLCLWTGLCSEGWVIFQSHAQAERQCKVKCIATIALNALPLNTAPKLLRTGNQINWHTLLTCPHKDHHMKVFTKATKSTC
jgi:hypothetical protein